MSYDVGDFYTNNKCYILPTIETWLLGVLNSNALWLEFIGRTTMVRGSFYEATTQNIEKHSFLVKAITKRGQKISQSTFIYELTVKLVVNVLHSLKL